MTIKTELIKETKTQQIENRPWLGPTLVTTIKTWEKHEVAGRWYVIETFQQDGVIYHSASYPLDSDYARAQIERG